MHNGKRTISISLHGAKNSKTRIGIKRPNRSKEYTPNYRRLADIQNIIERAISDSADFEIDLLDSSIWITVWNL